MAGRGRICAQEAAQSGIEVTRAVVIKTRVGIKRTRRKEVAIVRSPRGAADGAEGVVAVRGGQVARVVRQATDRPQRVAQVVSPRCARLPGQQRVHAQRAGILGHERADAVQLLQHVLAVVNRTDDGTGGAEHGVAQAVGIIGKRVRTAVRVRNPQQMVLGVPAIERVGAAA